MLIPIIKDFNNAFSYLVSGSAEKAKEMFGPLSRSMNSIVEGQPLVSGSPEQASLAPDIFQISWAGIRLCFLFLVQTVQYIISFQWLRDFAYLPISIPANTFRSSKTLFQAPDRELVQKVWEGPNVLQRYLFSNQTFSTWVPSHLPENGVSIPNSTTTPLPYNDFLMGSSHSGGAPINSWSLSFLSKDWFDPLTVPVNFLSEAGSNNSSQLSSSLPGKIMSLGHSSVSMGSNFLQDSNGSISISNMIIMSILICVATGFSSFFNSFFISFPLSLSNILSLRYLIIQKFSAGCLSILGIVLGEITFMLLLILPPPFIQITLVYLESVWPYIFGLSLIIFIITDFINNPYINTMSLSQTLPDASLQGNTYPSFQSPPIIPPKEKGWSGTQIKLGTTTSSSKTSSDTLGFSPTQPDLGSYDKIPKAQAKLASLSTILKAPYTKIFVLSFLLSLTEQSCCFSFFGSLNLSSTANFLDTYLFAASSSPITLFFSCMGFLFGSFLAFLIYNLALAKIIFLFSSYIHRFSNKASIIRSSLFLPRSNEPMDKKNSSTSYQEPSTKTNFVGRVGQGFGFNVSNFLTNLSNSFDAKKFLVNLNTYPRKVAEMGLVFVQRSKQFLQFVISYLPGGKRIFFFIFPGQATSYKPSGSNFGSAQRKAMGWDDRGRHLENQSSEQKTDFYNSAHAYGKEKQSVKKLQKVIPFFLSMETIIENRLLKHGSEPIQSSNNSSSTTMGLTAPKSSFLPSLKPVGKGLGSVPDKIYNKIDKILLTCLITLSFTTIPYYSFDYLVNSVFGFIPQDQILNAHSLRVNFADYSNLLGITLSDNNSVLNTDVSLYDRAHFMYGEWPNSFESLNYQGEYMWTNLRDHRRQKRTRRSTRLKFKTLKTKISTSWKEFKRSSGFSGEYLPTRDDSTSRYEDYQISDINKGKGIFNQEMHFSRTGNNSIQDDKANTKRDPRLREYTEKTKSIPETVSPRNLRYSAWSRPEQAKSTISDLFYKLFAFPKGLFYGKSGVSLDTFSETKGSSLPNADNSCFAEQNLPMAPDNYFTGKNMDSKRNSTRLSETIKPLSTSTFSDLSGGEKYIKTYPKNWKKAIIEKYYQNPIYQTLLSTDLKSFLKREPRSQQLTHNQENELYFLRIKMAHYYDSLRFYFTLKDQINITRPKINRSVPKMPSAESQNTADPYQRDSDTNKSVAWEENKNAQQVESWFKPNQKQEIITDKQNVGKESRFALPLPPFQFKSMTSMNYRQQFKGTLKTVKQLFAISLPSELNSEEESLRVRRSASKETTGSYSNFRNSTTKDMETMTSPIKSTYSLLNPIEKSYKYDKYLFNEHAYPKNEFLHEEAKNKKIASLSYPLPNGKKLKQLEKSSKDSQHKAPSSYENPNNTSPARMERHQKEAGISSATHNIYNMFGSKDPFYVGWDQNLRKFVLTSRILTRASALNHQVSPNSHMGRDSERSLASNSGLFAKQKDTITKNKKAGQASPDFSLQAKQWDESQNKTQQKSVQIYRPYTSWPFFKHQLKNLPNRPYFVLYENYLNILNKRIHLFKNININDIDTKSLTFLYSYSFNNNVKKYVSQLPINLYKQAMRPSSLENLFTPTSNARSSFLWPGSTMPAWEYYFW